MNRYLLLALHIISLVLLGFGWVLDILHIDISIHYIIDFNILVPLIKSGILFYIILAKNPKAKWQRFVSAISKWAMADVFAISIFVAFLGANAMESTKATLQPGFYYFAGYVILSGIVAAICGKMLSNSANNNV